MTSNAATATEPATAEDIRDSRQTTCCVVGGSRWNDAGAPAGPSARSSHVIEQHKDFDRDFRGDTIHPSIMEILDQIGLAGRSHQLRHARIYGPTLRAANSSFNPVDFRRLKTKFPYIFLVPQAKFLEFLAAEASKYPDFTLVMGATSSNWSRKMGKCEACAYLKC